jgi:hypothetical protein
MSESRQRLIFWHCLLSQRHDCDHAHAAGCSLSPPALSSRAESSAFIYRLIDNSNYYQKPFPDIIAFTQILFKRLLIIQDNPL